MRMRVGGGAYLVVLAHVGYELEVYVGLEVCEGDDEGCCAGDEHASCEGGQ